MNGINSKMLIAIIAVVAVVAAGAVYVFVIDDDSDDDREWKVGDYLAYTVYGETTDADETYQLTGALKATIIEISETQYKEKMEYSVYYVDGTIQKPLVVKSETEWVDKDEGQAGEKKGTYEANTLWGLKKLNMYIEKDNDVISTYYVGKDDIQYALTVESEATTMIAELSDTNLLGEQKGREKTVVGSKAIMSVNGTYSEGGVTGAITGTMIKQCVGETSVAVQNHVLVQLELEGIPVSNDDSLEWQIDSENEYGVEVRKETISTVWGDKEVTVYKQVDDGQTMFVSVGMVDGYEVPLKMELNEGPMSMTFTLTSYTHV